MDAYPENATQLLDTAIEWAKSESEIDGLAVVGSHARGSPRPDSDIDLVVISEHRDKFLTNPVWLNRFGPTKSYQMENWGLIQSLRVFFEKGLEVEFGFGDQKWVAIPTDSGTRNVISNGFRILYDPHGLLQRLQNGLNCHQAEKHQ